MKDFGEFFSPVCRAGNRIFFELLYIWTKISNNELYLYDHGHKSTNLARRIFYFPTGGWRVLVSLYKAIFEIGSRISISKILAQKGPEVPWPWESSTRQTETERAITKQASLFSRKIILLDSQNK